MAKKKPYTHEQTNLKPIQHRHPKRKKIVEETDYGTHIERHTVSFPASVVGEEDRIIVRNPHKHVIAESRYYQIARYDNEHKVIIIPLESRVEVFSPLEAEMLFWKCLKGARDEAGKPTAGEKLRVPKWAHDLWKKHGKRTHDNE